MAVTPGRPANSDRARAARSSALLLGSRDRPFGAAAEQAQAASTMSAGPTSRAYLEALADLTERWERGEAPGAELYLDGPSTWTASQAVELIYREYRLAEVAGRRPSAEAFLARFPEHRAALERLFRLDGACSDSLLKKLFRPRDDDAILPRVGDEIGPYILKRELGRGGFARVFLAEQADLEYRLVVVKVSTRPTREPWLLARARHANIVEILSHAEVDDGALQMICMPFRGGAPLSSILGRRRERPTAGGPGRRLLDDFEAVAAPEHPPTRAARERLGSMTDHRAFAWMVARLAEGLDHAYCQGVAHGDVKPSNVLLTADGEPMLLDFNLAQDWSFHDPETPVEDVGGTLAYMAPERLRVMASATWVRPRGGPSASQRAPGPGREEAGYATAAGPHRADVYSLGMVLLEAVAGWSPVDDDDRGWGPSGRRSFRESAARYAAIRERGAAEVVRRAEVSGGAAVPPDLRPILMRCLEADPAARYARAAELAEDLDRWRANLPLAFAPEPSRLLALARWLRRNRRGVAVATFALALSTVTAAAFTAKGNWALADVRGSHAADYLAQHWDDVASPAFHYQRPGFPASRRRDQAEETAAALRALKDYKVLEPGDWREKDGSRYLPEADREDLELWLLEQAYRAGLGLAERPDSPDDWRRARTLIDRACGAAVPRVMAALRERLEAQLAAAGVENAPPAEGREPAPHVEEYLLGVAAELDDPGAAPVAAGPGMTLLDPKADPWADARQTGAAGATLEAALEHYRRLLTLRPGSFWGHYRSAAIAFRLRRWGEAASGIETCLARRPKNPILHGFLATCLLNLERSDAALDASNQALDAAPDHAEFVQTRAFIRAGMPKASGVEADIQRYEMLKSMLPESFFRSPTIMDLANSVAGTVAASQRELPLARPRKSRPSPGELLADGEEIDPGELTARAVLAARLRESGKTKIASVEIDKILAIDPSYIVARVDHLYLAILNRRFDEARDDIDLIVDDPRLVEYVTSSVQRAHSLMDASRVLAVEGEIRDALKLAEKTLKLILAAGKTSGRACYMAAAVESMAARTEPSWLPIAAGHLRLAIAANPDYEQWFLRDRAFAAVRMPIRAMLEEARASR
jgi:serine/threonine protein kinase